MENKLQCPQCGSTTSIKVSEGVYHCPYCESNFNVETPKQDIFSTFVKASQQNQNDYAERVAKLRALTSPEALAKNKRVAKMIVGVVFAFIFLAGAIAYFSVRAAMKNVMVPGLNGLLANSSLEKFKVFGGSKGTAIWLLQEQSASMQDSTHYILSIVDPKTKKHLSDIEFIKAMTWSDAFNSSKYIGELYPFGDTCWIISEEYGLQARDIYTGKIIVTADQLGKMYPDLSKGISKAEWGYSDLFFKLTTTDGFEFKFYPNQKKVVKADDSETEDKKSMITRNFFILSDTKRPALFKSVEKAMPYATSPKTYDSDLENFDPKKRAWGLNDDVISITPLLPDQTYFNGWIEYMDNDKAIIIYQNSVAKKSELHVSSVSADGKVNWDISGKEIKPFRDIFADNKRGIDYVYTPTELVLFYEYGDHNAVGIDWNTGKILWTYSPDDSKN